MATVVDQHDQVLFGDDNTDIMDCISKVLEVQQANPDFHFSFGDDELSVVMGRGIHLNYDDSAIFVRHLQKPKEEVCSEPSNQETTSSTNGQVSMVESSS